MTRQEELTYLFGILSEASKWTASPDDNRDLVRLEVEERIHNLINGVEPEPDENGLIQSSIHPDNLPAEAEALTNEDFKALEAARLNEHLASPEKVEKAWQKQWKWKLDKVRVKIDGKIVWKPKAECTQEPRDNSHGGPSWQWVWHDPNEKKSQEDEMWENHEAGND